MKPSVAEAQLKRDEQFLLRMFRLLRDSERGDLLKHVGETLAARVSLDAHARLDFDHPSVLRTEELEEGLDARLRRSMPPQEPWDYLDDWIVQTLSYAWADETASVIFGSSAFDQTNAEQLLHEVAETAANQHFTEQPPPFDADAMLDFIREWRERAVKALESNSIASARFVVADVLFTASDETFYVLNSRDRQALYLADSVDELTDKLERDGWSRSGQIGRWDGAAVALWSRGNDYVATWDSAEQPIQKGGHK